MNVSQHSIFRFLFFHNICVAFVFNRNLPSCQKVGHGIEGGCLTMSESSNADETLFFGKPVANNTEEVLGSTELPNFSLLEQQVLANTQAELDVKRVKDALLGGLKEESEGTKPIDLMTQNVNETSTDPDAPPPSKLSIALAAGSAVGLTSLAALQLPIISLGAFAATTFIASRDPIKDEDFLEGDLSGPISRIVGRATLDSVEKSKPTVQAVVRAVVARDEMEDLRQQVKDLQKENEQLKLKLDTIDAVEKQAKKFTMTELKALAKKDDIKVAGTKAQLMMRLVEAGCLTLDVDSS